MSSKSVKPLSVRITPDAYKMLIKYTSDKINKSRGITQAQVIEGLIRYFAEQNPEQQNLIVMGLATDYLDLFGRALQNINWGDHAYSKNFIPWAIESYSALDSRAAIVEISKRKISDEAKDNKNIVGIMSLRRIAWYMLGSCWMDLAMELRHRSLVEFSEQTKNLEKNKKPRLWEEYYKAAIYSLKVAISYHRFFHESIGDDTSRNKKNEAPHPVVIYNEACAWTLIAQYTMEQFADNGELKNLAKKEKEKDNRLLEERNKSNELMENVSKIDLPPKESSQIENALQKAVDCLEQITIKYAVETEDVPLEETGWLFDYAETDSDLAFLRKSEEKGEAFMNWINKREKSITIIDSYSNLRNKLPEFVISRADSIKLS